VLSIYVLKNEVFSSKIKYSLITKQYEELRIYSYSKREGFLII